LNTIDNEKGAVLVVALIIMGLLVVIGTSITMTSSIEMNIARNEKVAQTAFYRAENARVLATRIIRSVFSGESYSDGDEYDQTGSDVFVMDGDFPHEALNDSDIHTGAPDVRVGTSALVQAFVDVDKLSVGPLPGGSAEFGSGYEGAGKAGSTQTIYQIESHGRRDPNTEALVRVNYRQLP